LAAGLTQAALAERAGVAERTIQDLERGAARPRWATVRRLAAALGLLPAARAELEAVSSAPRRRARGTRESGSHASRSQTEMLAARRPGTSPATLLDARPTNLPIQPTALLGRERELGEIRALLRDSARLVTLTGSGGVGKTRVAVEVAGALLDDFADGVFLVELAPLSDPALVPSAITQAFGRRDQGGRTLLEGLKEYLRSRSLLLLLDNFEHIVTTAPLIAELLAASPRLAVLATSREPLRLRGEREYGVMPLALPGAVHAPPARELASYPAVALFVERAAAMRPGFTVTDESTATIAEICARLDGLPLAIELAAARVRHLTIEALRARLASRLQLLTGGARDLPTRQQTLRDTIGWSHDLLDASERRLFRCLAVFVGGFTLDAAEAVSGEADVLDVDVLNGVASLVEKNLVRFEDTADQPRYGMLETIREYGLEKLRESGEEATIRARHQRWLLTLAERGAPLLTGVYSMADFERLGAEIDNIRVALAWGRDTATRPLTNCGSMTSSAPSPVQAALRLATATYLLWFWRGMLGEGRAWIEQLLELDEASGEPETPDRRPARMRALIILGSLMFMSGDLESAGPPLTDGAARAAAADDLIAQYQTLVIRGGVALMSGQPEQATTLLDESLRLAHAGAFPHLVMTSQYYLGEAALAGGDLDRAEALFDVVAAAARADGVTWGMADALNGLARIASARGDHARAAALLPEGLPARLSLDDRVGQTHTLEALAWQIAALGDAERAAVLLGATAALRDRYGLEQGGLTSAGTNREAALAAARAGLDLSTFDAAFDHGRRLSWAEAIDLALRDDRGLEGETGPE
jgi:predicted ATPase/transcriptional regulator with XRE-family HTH domain